MVGISGVGGRFKLQAGDLSTGFELPTASAPAVASALPPMEPSTPRLVAQQAPADAPATSAVGTGRVLGPDGRVAGATVDLGGQTVGAYVAALSPQQLQSLAPADRAELARMAALQIKEQEDNGRTGQLMSPRDLREGQMALERLYSTYRPSPERMEELRGQTAAFVEEFKGKYDLKAMSARWLSMSPSDKQEVLQDIHEMHARQFGFEPTTIDYVTKARSREEAVWLVRTAGSYNSVTNAIRVNGSPTSPGPQDFFSMAGAVFHEGIHRRQDLEAEQAVANGLPQPIAGEAGDVAMHWANFQDWAFVFTTNMPYELNPLEQEAWIATDIMLTGLGKRGLLPIGSPLRDLVQPPGS